MSAKPGKKSASKPTSSTAAVATADVGAGTAPTAPVPWIDSTDPRRKMIGKVVLVGVWLYVAALWLLALDQTFNLGIFGPKMPTVP